MARKSGDSKQDDPPSYFSEKQQQPPLLPLHRPPGEKMASSTGAPRRLRVLGASWGGVVVTNEIASMVSAQQAIRVDMATLFTVLQPDPCPDTAKTLAVLYQADGHEGPSLLLAPEGHPQRVFVMDGAVHDTAQQHLLMAPWRSRAAAGAGPTASAGGAAPRVEILAVTYGPHRIDTPAVMEDLAGFFEGRRGQIRMTNMFFRGDPAPGLRKAWAVFFRFGPQGRVHVVTGMEDGALEEPWSRW